MQPARKILYPFSIVYGGLMLLRNKLYDNGIFKSTSFKIPVISVGNLSFGGTGKTPMVEYLIKLLKKDYRLATLSRGYNRKTSGFRLLEGNETAAEVGDEPLQFKTKFPEITVAVDESRTNGITKLLSQTTPPELIILDDAFQHRKVRADLHILLTPCKDLYSDDLVLPAGNLREPGRGAKRAKIIIVTKCPADLREEEKDKIKAKLNLQPEQRLFFSAIGYDETVRNKSGSLILSEFGTDKFVLITGIADPDPLKKFLSSANLEFEHHKFPDHHNFSVKEIKAIKDKLGEKKILTTEKDFMRLKAFFPASKLYFLPIRVEFYREAEQELQKLVKQVIQQKLQEK